MVKRSRKANNSEFPVLDGLGLYPAATKGDGNCLFRALSDQVYGDESHHKELRQKIVGYVKENGDHFSAFVGEYGETFEQYTSRLAQDGVYGGHIEIVGFADINVMPVVIYQAETLYVVEPQVAPRSQWGKPVHIAYHTWEHYSSVRKIGGPQNGPVDFDIPQLSDLPFIGGDDQDTSKSTEEVPPWKINIVQKSVPDASEELIISMLRTKDHEQVIEELILKEFETPGNDQSAESNDGEGQTAAKEEGSQNLASAALSKSEDSVRDESTIHEKPSKITRKQDAKKRRSEKRERVRAKKSRSKKNTEDTDTSEVPKSGSVSGDKPKIITI